MGVKQSSSNSPPSPGKERIAELLALINSACQDAVTEYEKSGHGIPSSAEEHPMDSLPDALELKKAIRVLEGACEQLCSTLAQPMHTMVNRSMSYEASCMRLVVDLKIADILSPFSDGLHIDDIAIKANVDGGKLVHMLRLLAMRGCFTEVTPNVFANNRLSLTLISSNPISAIIGLNTGECMRAIGTLPDAMTHPDYAFSKDAKKCAFVYSVKDELKDSDAGLFDWYRLNPDKAQRFNRAMVGWSNVTGSLALVKHYPWSELPAESTFCDVGSGVGALTVQLAKAHPHLKITLQDLTGPLEAAESFWRQEHLEAVQGERVDFVAIDFLKETPVKGQDVYYMKHIIHDWPDSDAVMIMQNISQAMHSNSRLLIHEHVLQHVCESDNPDIQRAPKPLLPNYGSGKYRLYSQDLNMLAMFNSKERTYEEFVTLGAKSGLRLHKVWDLAETSVLEFRPSDSGSK